MLSHSDILSWIRTKQYLLLLLNVVWLAEQQQIPILVFGLIQYGLEHTTYHTGGEYANHYTTDEPTTYHTGGEYANHYTTDEPATYHTGGEYANHYTTDVV